jgi:hypothetical protein
VTGGCQKPRARRALDDVAGDICQALLCAPQPQSRPLISPKCTRWGWVPGRRGLHSPTSELNLKDLQDTSLAVQLNLSTFGTHPRINLGHAGDKASFS